MTCSGPLNLAAGIGSGSSPALAPPARVRIRIVGLPVPQLVTTVMAHTAAMTRCFTASSSAQWGQTLRRLGTLSLQRADDVGGCHRAGEQVAMSHGAAEPLERD